MNATIQTDFNDRLRKLEGLTNAQLLEQEQVRFLFRRAAERFDGDDCDDLMQQAIIRFLQGKEIDSYEYESFSHYLVSMIKHAVSKAHQWRSRKKRNFPAKHFAHDKETGKLIDPVGEQAAVLFSSNDVSRLVSVIQERIECKDRKRFVLDVLRSFLDGNTLSEIARHLGSTPNKIQSAFGTIRAAFERGNDRPIRKSASPAKATAAKRSWAQDQSCQKRLRQLRRVIAIASIVRKNPARRLGEIHDLLQASSGLSVCERTVSRDLYALIQLGLVSKLHSIHGVVYEFSDGDQFWPFSFVTPKQVGEAQP
jgi:RNA polymerase sigma factor (sigma-70 family)